MLKNTSGIHLILKIGPNIAQPASYDVTTALTRLEVTDNADERDGFQMTFTLNKVKSSDYNLVQDGTLDPKSRVKIGVRLNGRTEMLIDGIITQHQFAPSNEPGTFTLTVTGEDISLKFDLEEKNLSFRNMSDSAIVQQVLGRYADLGLKNEIDDTDDTPHENQREHGRPAPTWHSYKCLRSVTASCSTLIQIRLTRTWYTGGKKTARMYHNMP